MASLIVDLQTELLRTDLARESFWQALADSEWRRLLAGRGKAGAFLPGASADDLANLPMNEAAVEAMRRRRAEGGRVVLVTDAPDAFAKRFAAALDFIDEAVGGVPSGAERAAWLAARWGEGGYDYAAGRHGERPDSSARRIVSYLKALRPHQWVKNLLVFLPMIAAHRFDQATFLLGFVAFVSFSLVAAGVYVLNDLLDLAADRAHPRKRFRPMASGAVPLRHAAAMAAACIVTGLLLASSAGLYFFLALSGYTILTTAYSLRLKREPVLDVCALAALYTLRIVAGALAVAVSLSVWLLAFSIFIFLSLAAIKRQAELVANLHSGREKPAGRGYRVDDLPIVEIMGVTAGYAAVLVLALYLNTPIVLSLYQTPQFLWAVCAIVLYWISRAALIAHRGEMHDDPVVFALRDRVSHACVAGALAAFAAASWT